MGKCILAGHPPVGGTKIKSGMCTLDTYQHIQLDFVPQIFVFSRKLGGSPPFASIYFHETGAGFEVDNVVSVADNPSGWYFTSGTGDTGITIAPCSGNGIPASVWWLAIG